MSGSGFHQTRGPQPRQTGRTDTDLRKTYMCSICLSRSGQAPVARSSSRLHKQIPSFTMSISRIHRPIRRRTRRSQERPRHKGARATSGGKWWSQTGSNRRPEACKATALPTELWPRLTHTSGSQSLRPTSIWWAWEDSNFRPHAYQARALTN